MGTHPFFSLLLMYLRFIAVPKMQKISTNGRCIYFSPDFLDKLYERELDYILCHEIMHIIGGHIWRSYGKKSDDYHFACDILANALLSAHGFQEARYPHLGHLPRELPPEEDPPYAKTPEEVLARLPYSIDALDEKTRQTLLTDSDLFWDQKEDRGGAGILILDRPEEDSLWRERQAGKDSATDDGDGLLEAWQDRAATAARAAGSYGGGAQGADSVPASVKRMIAERKRATVNWRRMLNDFIQERVCDYSFSPPDRRFADTGFLLPDFNEKDFVSREILFMVDTSGSVKEAELSAVYAELCGAILQFGGKLQGMLGFFDAAVKRPLPFESIGDLMRITPYGGGGTSFAAVFAYIRRHYAECPPACVVIFTDGAAPYPAEREAMGIPVLWLINNFDITPPWGRVARLPAALKD
ncbi:MAG: hypothetical protein J6V07_00775 [Clostridia bacterium]|nr:hypothetical protein [Clostridia bacterium]